MFKGKNLAENWTNLVENLKKKIKIAELVELAYSKSDPGPL